MDQPINTDLLPATERLEAWNQVVSDTFCPMACESTGDGGEVLFSGKLQTSQLNRVGLSTIQSSPIRAYRSNRHIAHASDDLYLVKFQLEGEALFKQRGQEAHLQPGDFVLCSNSDPYELSMPTHYRQAVLAIPKPTLSETVKNPDQFLGYRMASQVGANGLLSQFVQSLLQRIDSLDPELTQHLESNLLDLLITSLNFAKKDSDPALQSVQTEHMYRVKNYISRHFSDPDLAPEGIAKYHGISTRYLHILFQGEELTVSRYIQRMRLEACKRCLANPKMNKLSATQIAYQWGFNDVSHFNRSFKKLFNTTPRQYRLMEQAQQP